MSNEVKTIKRVELDKYLKDGWRFCFMEKNGDIIITKPKPHTNDRQI